MSVGVCVVVVHYKRNPKQALTRLQTKRRPASGMVCASFCWCELLSHWGFLSWSVPHSYIGCTANQHTATCQSCGHPDDWRNHQRAASVQRQKGRLCEILHGRGLCRCSERLACSTPFCASKCGWCLYSEKNEIAKERILSVWRPLRDCSIDPHYVKNKRTHTHKHTQINTRARTYTRRERESEIESERERQKDAIHTHFYSCRTSDRNSLWSLRGSGSHSNEATADSEQRPSHL